MLGRSLAGRPSRPLGPHEIVGQTRRGQTRWGQVLIFYYSFSSSRRSLRSGSSPPPPDGGRRTPDQRMSFTQSVECRPDPQEGALSVTGVEARRTRVGWGVSRADSSEAGDPPESARSGRGSGPRAVRRAKRGVRAAPPPGRSGFGGGSAEGARGCETSRPARVPRGIDAPIRLAHLPVPRCPGALVPRRLRRGLPSLGRPVRLVSAPCRARARPGSRRPRSSSTR